MNKRIPSFILVTFIILLLFVYFKTNTQSETIQSKTVSISIVPVTDADHIRGNKDAQLTVVEYSDFECPECQFFQPISKQILQVYGTKIRWIVRPYPLPQHINAEKEAEAAECIAELEGNTGYWKFSDLLFSQEKVTEHGTGFPLEELTGIAQKIGVNQSQFNHCLDSSKYYSKIANYISNAEKSNIQQLPSTVLIDKKGNIQLVVGDQPFSVFKNMIDNALTE